jgi:pimeloyl-ACP methyl ester carboxylesterase
MIVPIEHGRYLAAHIPGAKYVELQGSDHFWFDADSEAILAEVQEFITGVRPGTGTGPRSPDRAVH